MASEYDEVVLRITARYVEEVRAGREPRLSDYLARYPQYAEAITDFVVYYHALESQTPPAPAQSMLPPLSERSQAAMQRALKRLSVSADTLHAASGSGQNSLLWQANRPGITLTWLAGETDLSLDILRKLEMRAILAATIPYEVVRRVALALRQPLSIVLISLGSREQDRAARGVAETAATYQSQPGEEGGESFRQAIENSAELTDRQRAEWLSLLEQEGL